jgi:hypothetical protein
MVTLKYLISRCFAFFAIFAVFAGLLAVLTSSPVKFNGEDQFGVASFFLIVIYMSFSSVLWALFIFVILRGGDIVVKLFRRFFVLAIVVLGFNGHVSAQFENCPPVMMDMSMFQSEEFSITIRDNSDVPLFTTSKVKIGGGEIEVESLKNTLQSKLGKDADLFRVNQLPSNLTCSIDLSDDELVIFAANLDHKEEHINMLFAYFKSSGSWDQYGFVSRVNDCLFLYYDDFICSIIMENRS